MCIRDRSIHRTGTPPGHWTGTPPGHWTYTPPGYTTGVHHRGTGRVHHQGTGRVHHRGTGRNTVDSPFTGRVHHRGHWTGKPAGPLKAIGVNVTFTDNTSQTTCHVRQCNLLMSWSWKWNVCVYIKPRLLFDHSIKMCNISEEFVKLLDTAEATVCREANKLTTSICESVESYWMSQILRSGERVLWTQQLVRRLSSSFKQTKMPRHLSKRQSLLVDDTSSRAENSFTW